MSTNYQLKGKIIIKGKIEIKTGLAIGGSKSSLNIGGVDNPVIKDSEGFPYIPGSTIKGKLRSLLEQSKYPLREYKKKKYNINDGKGFFDKDMVIHRFSDKEGKIDDIIKIFGDTEVDEPRRGIFRDSFLDKTHFEKNKENLFKNLELDYTEVKWENMINRITARAVPRPLERIPRGAFFDFEMILDLFSKDDEKLLKTLIQGLKLLEDDYLGGSGTRGSGKIAFNNMSMILKRDKYYTTEEQQIILVDKFNLKDIIGEKWFSDVFNKISL